MADSDRGVVEQWGCFMVRGKSFAWLRLAADFIGVNSRPFAVQLPNLG
jgi:hypothetical protein